MPPFSELLIAGNQEIFKTNVFELKLLQRNNIIIPANSYNISNNCWLIIANFVHQFQQVLSEK